MTDSQVGHGRPAPGPSPVADAPAADNAAVQAAEVRKAPEWHPLAKADSASGSDKGQVPQRELRMPGPGGPAIWDVVDEAVHRAFCEGLVYRMLTLCIVFITLATVTSLAWASNWCGVLCGCCCKEKAK